MPFLDDAALEHIAQTAREIYAREQAQSLALHERRRQAERVAQLVARAVDPTTPAPLATFAAWEACRRIHAHRLRVE